MKQIALNTSKNDDRNLEYIINYVKNVVQLTKSK